MLSDVGLADLNGSGDPKKTDAMQFMAPELVFGEKIFNNNKTDIWSLGAILYFLITLKVKDIYENTSGSVKNIQKLIDETFTFDGKIQLSAKL